MMLPTATGSALDQTSETMLKVPFVVLSLVAAVRLGWFVIPAVLNLRLRDDRARATCAVALGLGLHGTVGILFLRLLDETDGIAFIPMFAFCGPPVIASGILVVRGMAALPVAPDHERSNGSGFRWVGLAVGLIVAMVTVWLGSRIEPYPWHLSRWGPSTFVDWTIERHTALHAAGAVYLGLGIGMLPSLVPSAFARRAIDRIATWIIVFCCSTVGWMAMGQPYADVAFTAWAGPLIAATLFALLLVGLDLHRVAQLQDAGRAR